MRAVLALGRDPFLFSYFSFFISPRACHYWLIILAAKEAKAPNSRHRGKNQLTCEFTHCRIWQFEIPIGKRQRRICDFFRYYYPRYYAVLLHKKVPHLQPLKYAAARYMSKLRASYQGRGSIAVQAKTSCLAPYSAYSASRPCKGPSGVLRCRGYLAAWSA